MRWVNVLLFMAIASHGMTDTAHRQPEEPSLIVELTDANFDDLTRDASGSAKWFVMFYQPTCGICIGAIPVMEALARVTKADPEIKIGRIELSDANRDLALRFQVRGVPKVFLLHGGQVYKYQYLRSDTVTDLKKFIQSPGDPANAIPGPLNPVMRLFSEAMIHPLNISIGKDLLYLINHKRYLGVGLFGVTLVIGYFAGKWFVTPSSRRTRPKTD